MKHFQASASEKITVGLYFRKLKLFSRIRLYWSCLIYHPYKSRVIDVANQFKTSSSLVNMETQATFLANATELFLLSLNKLFIGWLSTC